jgi:hypothetical protein
MTRRWQYRIWKVKIYHLHVWSRFGSCNRWCCRSIDFHAAQGGGARASTR